MRHFLRKKKKILPVVDAVFQLSLNSLKIPGIIKP